jgi:3-hydroxyisobutyrate dehydrogenase-like beta-hydroxyacid dehydrogenase
MSKVGVVGSGALAQAVTARLLEFGRPVVVWGPDSEGLKEDVRVGAVAASTAAAVSSQAQVVIVAAVDGAEAEEWHLGNHGVVQGIREGGVVVDMTTVAPALARKLASAYQAAGGDYLDAPISGGAPAARSGNLVVMVGGAEKAYDLAAPVLEPLVRIMVRVGEAGAGATAKLCSQLMCFVNLCGVCEALTLGAKAGIDLQKLFSVVSAGAAQSWELDNMAPKILARDLASGYPLSTSQYDLSLVLDAARELKVFLPATSTVHQLYHAVETEGEKGKSSQSLIRALEKMSGVEVKG